MRAGHAGGVENGGREKNGAPLPQPVKPAGGGTPPHVFFTLDYSDLAAV